MTEVAPAELAQLRQEIARVTAAAREAPLDVVNLFVEEMDEGPVIRGRVLTQRQGREVHELARRYGARHELQVLAEPAARLELAWLQLAQGKLELWRRPDTMGVDEARETEYLADDGPVRLLGRVGGAALVQGPDLTLGWIDPSGIQEIDGSTGRHSWARWQRAEEGAMVALPTGAVRAIPVSPGRPSEAKHVRVTRGLLDAARSTLGARYRWGGTTDQGYDCSGLVQRLYSATTGVMLPKHTADQRRMGIRVVPGDGEAGDLLFASPRGERVGHVMLLTSPESVLHACRSLRLVVEESIEENAERYEHVGLRRPVALREGG